MHRHPQRDCVYAEALACIELGMDDPAVIFRQVRRYALDGFAEGAGLPAGGGLPRRHSGAVASFNGLWEAEFEQGSRRDQLSVSWALARSGLRHATFASDIFTGPLFGGRPREGEGPPV